MRIIYLVILLSIVQSAFACTCEEDPVAKKFEESDFVYLGQITKARINEKGLVENTLKPTEIFKGVPDQWLLLSMSGPMKQCRTYAAVGLIYVIYGKLGEIPRLSMCSFSQPIGLELDNEITKLRGAANRVREGR